MNRLIKTGFIIVAALLAAMCTKDDPTCGHVKIGFSKQQSPPTKVKIYTEAGNEILTRTVSEWSVEIDLNAGNYKVQPADPLWEGTPFMPTVFQVINGRTTQVYYQSNWGEVIME